MDYNKPLFNVLQTRQLGQYKVKFEVLYEDIHLPSMQSELSIPLLQIR